MHHLIWRIFRLGIDIARAIFNVNTRPYFGPCQWFIRTADLRGIGPQQIIKNSKPISPALWGKIQSPPAPLPGYNWASTMLQVRFETFIPSFSEKGSFYVSCHKRIYLKRRCVILCFNIYSNDLSEYWKTNRLSIIRVPTISNSFLMGPKFEGTSETLIYYVSSSAFITAVNFQH